MIPILFDAFVGRKDGILEYNNNGLGALVDAGYCTVTEERNGAFELQMQYPVNGHLYKELTVDRQIFAKPNEINDPQAFRIYKISKPMNGVVTVNAEHISYELSSVIVNPFEAVNAAEAMSKIKASSISENRFDFWTDKSTVANMSPNLPSSARSLLGGTSLSVLNVYGGEYEFDNYLVKLHNNRGYDNGVVIAYAKNLTGVKCEERLDGVITGAIAVWTVQDENGNTINEVYGDLKTIETGLSYSRNVVIDCSSDFETEPTKEQLNEKAEKYIESHKNLPYFSVSVEFVNLGDTEEYKEYKGLERVSLCDIVTVRHPLYGINVKAKVVKTVFDSINEKYEKIEIGEASANISNTIAAQEKEIAQKVTYSALEKAVANATNAITGNKGGYVVLNKAEGQEFPTELLILDKPSINQAVNVWRWNMGGLGHSSTGYNGRFTTAMTADGQIVADFITTGTLNAANLEVLNLSADSISSGVLSSKNGLSQFSLNDGHFKIGGDTFYTRIWQGEIEQYWSNANGLVGGIVPVENVQGDSAYETIYYNSENEEAQGVMIGAMTAERKLFSIARFSIKETSVSCGSSDEKGYFTAARFMQDGIELNVEDGGAYFPSADFKRDEIKFNVGLGNGSHFTSARFTKEDIKFFVNVGNGFFPAAHFTQDEITFRVRHGEDTSSKVASFQYDIAQIWTDLNVNGTVTGTNISASSDRKIKKNIKPTSTSNALNAVKSLKVYDYELKESGKSVKMGLMADEAPKEILGDDEKSINLYSYCGMLAMAVRELSEKVESLEGNGNGRKNQS